jgi:hypothetical protein
MARESTIGSAFKLENLPINVTTPITLTTKANPTVITTTLGATAVVGDFVVITGTGSKTLDRLTAHRVMARTGTTISINTDTTNDAGAAPTTGAIRIVSVTEVCFAEFGIDNPAPNEVDVTTMCDVTRKNVAGLPNTGSATFGGPLDLADAGQVKLLAAFNDAKARNLIWITRGGQTGIMYGVVNSYAAGPQGVEQPVTYSGSFQIQEQPIYLASL